MYKRSLNLYDGIIYVSNSRILILGSLNMYDGVTLIPNSWIEFKYLGPPTYTAVSFRSLNLHLNTQMALTLHANCVLMLKPLVWFWWIDETLSANMLL